MISKLTVLLFCLANLVFISENQASTRKVLIFVPGYYGSILIDKATGNEVFLNLPSIFFRRDALQLEPSLNFVNPLKVGGIFKSFSVLPGIYSIDAYGDSLKQISDQSKKHNLEMLSFAYDWRLDPIFILRQFEDQLRKWGIQLEKDEVTLVAHSKGAWLMSYWLRFGAQPPTQAIEQPWRLKLVKRVLLVAAPFRGTLAIFRNAFFGAPGLPNDRYLGPKKISSFPSTLYLTPNEGSFLLESGQSKTLFLKDPEQWKTNRWGPYQFWTGSNVDVFMQYHLTESKAWYEKLHSPLESATMQDFNDLRVKVHIYVGTGSPTNDRGVILFRPNGLFFAFTKKQQNQLGVSPTLLTDVDGDQTISTESAMPPRYLIESGLGEVYFKKKGHLELLRDSDSIDWNSFFKL